MGHTLKYLYFIFIIAICESGCTINAFDESEDVNVFYQVYSGQDDILRLRQTDGEGAPAIQLFNKDGKKLQEFKITPKDGLLMTLVKNDSIQITYFIGQHDLQMFLPWFKTNKFNPKQIGHYKIYYRYEVRNKYSKNIGSEVDSISLDKKMQSASLFLNHKMITEKPMYLFVVESSMISEYDPKTQSYSRYVFTKKHLKETFMHKVIMMYQHE